MVRGDAANPVRADEVEAKFLSLTSGPLGERRALEVIEAVEKMDLLEDVRSLSALLVPVQP